MQDRAAAGRDRVDQHHRRAHAHARDLGLEGALVLAVEMGDVGRGAAHVEADDARRSRPRAPVSAMRDDAAGRAGEDGVLALEEIGRREAARRHHEHQPGAGSRSGIGRPRRVRRATCAT